MIDSDIETRFPQGADRYIQVFEWEMDEVLPAIVMMMFGIMLKSYVVMGMGLVLSKFYIYLKRKSPNNFMFIGVYTLGLLGVKGSLPGYIKKFME